MLAVEAEAQIQRAMASLWLRAAPAGLLSTLTAHLDEASAHEARLIEQKPQLGVLGALVLGKGGAWEHSDLLRSDILLIYQNCKRKMPSRERESPPDRELLPNSLTGLAPTPVQLSPMRNRCRSLRPLALPARRAHDEIFPGQSVREPQRRS
jgi:hypothetical protein